MTVQLAPYDTIMQSMRSLYGPRSVQHQTDARVTLTQYLEDPIVGDLLELNELARLRVWTVLQHPAIPNGVGEVRANARVALTEMYREDPEATIMVRDLATLMKADPLTLQYALLRLEDDLEIEVYSVARHAGSVPWNFAAVRMTPVMVELKRRRQQK